MPQRYDKYKIKAILLFSIIICLFATRFIYYSTLLKHVEDKADFDFLFKEYYPQLYYYAFHLINNMEASKDIVSDAFEFIWANSLRPALTGTPSPEVTESFCRVP